MAEEKKCPCETLLKAQEEIVDHRQQLREGEVSIAKINLTLENIETKVDKLEEKIDKKFDAFSQDIENLKMKPAERWDGLVTILITLIVGAVFGLICSKIGL